MEESGSNASQRASTTSPTAPRSDDPHLNPTCCSRASISSCNGVSSFETSGGRCRHNAPSKRHGDALLEGAAARAKLREPRLRVQGPSNCRQPLATPNTVSLTAPAICQPSHNVPRLPARSWANPIFPQGSAGTA